MGSVNDSHLVSVLHLVDPVDNEVQAVCNGTYRSALIVYSSNYL